METIMLNDWSKWQEVAYGSLVIKPDLPISRFSKFGSDVWDFRDPDNFRLRVKSPHLLMINWEQHKEIIPYDILYSIKVLGYFYAYYPAVLCSGRLVKKRGIAPTYCCLLINSLLSFMTELCVQSSLPVTSVGVAANYINEIADISVLDIQRTLPHWNSKGLGIHLRKALSDLTSPLLHAYMPSLASGKRQLQWTLNDLLTIEFYIKKRAPDGQGIGFRDKPLQDELFTFLTKSATIDVVSFLLKLGLPIQTPMHEYEAYKGALLAEHHNFSELYGGLIEMANSRNQIAQEDILSGKKGRSRDREGVLLYKRKFGIDCVTVKRLVQRCQMAAQYLLIQFTGVRYSEAISIKVGCIKELHSGDFVIKGTVSKGAHVNAPINTDYWVACPIVRDAVAVLEELTKLTQNNFLFAASLYASTKKNDKPLTNNALATTLTKYLYDIDNERKYSSESSYHTRFDGVDDCYRPTPHRLRHTLALHMSRAGLGIPYISFHLKHVYQGYKRLQSVQDVTLHYGGIGNDIFSSAVGISQASRELVHTIYHPQATVVGPGAAEFKRNREFYFTGMLEAGWNLDEIMEYLAMQGLPMADVGLGYCQGRREIQQEDGSKMPPPCLGQLKCNPNRCNNAVITISKIPIWIKVYRENKLRLMDPLMAHAANEHAYFMEEAKQTLINLGVNVDEL